MEKYEFSKELFDGLINYLVTKPYAEVAELLALIHKQINQKES